MTTNFPQADIKEQSKGTTPLQLHEWKPLLMVGGFFFTVCMALVLHRHFTFYSSYDQGIFNQVMWNGTQGNFFQSSLSSQLSTNVVHAGEVPDVSYHRLGQHFTPALLLWLPLYSWFPQAATLSVLLVTVISAAGMVLYVLARQYLEPIPARWITCSYYGAHAVIGPTLCNFHDNFQLPLFMFTLLLAMEKRWWWLFALMCPLILAIREDTGIALFGVGMYMILSRRFPRIGAMVCVLSFGYILALTNLIMPLFSDDISKRFMLEQFGQFTDAQEASTLDIIKGMLMSPGKLAIELVTPFSLTLRYIIAQWLPFAFVPVVAPTAWIITGFPLLKLFSGQTTSLLSVNVRYAIAVVPGLCYGAILWWSGEGFNNFFQPNKPRQPRALSRVSKRVWAICLSISIFLAIAANPNRTLYFIVPDSVEPWVYVSPLQQWQRSQEIHNIIGRIPEDASVAATTYIIPHLSSRREIIRSPFVFIKDDNGQVETVDYVVVDLWRLVRYQPAFGEDRESLNIHVGLINHLLTTSQYGITEFINGVVLMEKNVNSVPEKLQQWQAYEQSIQPVLNQVM
ncbi:MULTISPECIES: DUF2079 domain-containing protein [unclassified Roseofilum]|uniref:DUF2079 domain-containing protein n=1 Tax=unclassified Roseofilum TaxID=2620099 RepID=UPI000E916F61|nr:MULTISPECIES: DUF2079 domain-containing protein [unclassified Roseofilum]HBQ99670.1 hypothetical protein [Cyanobacteria bacterium UBA11691]